MIRVQALVGAALVAVLLASPAAADPGGQGKGSGKSPAVAAERGPPKAMGKGATKDRAAEPARVGRNPHEHHAAAEASSRRVVGSVRIDNVFDRDDEALIRRYYGAAVACPPGLAAKNNGCQPPGQAKKGYDVGTVLPRDIYLAPLPGDLLGRLPRVPDGYRYGRYNGDVYLVEDATRRIVDTIVFNLLR